MTEYNSTVKALYPHAEWTDGEGRYALLAHCGGSLTITLWTGLDDAKREKRELDDTGCGGGCSKCHEILDLETDAVAVDAWNVDKVERQKLFKRRLTLLRQLKGETGKPANGFTAQELEQVYLLWPDP